MRDASKAKIAALAAASVLAVIFGGSAHAASFIGAWTTTYGSPFTNLGWRGTAEYFVPDSCVPGGTADVSNATDCSGLAAVAAARVELYDITDVGRPTISTLVFEPASMIVDTLRFISGEMTQLHTSLSAYVPSVGDLSAFGIGSATAFSLGFDILDGPRLHWTECTGQGGTPSCTSGLNDSIYFPATFTITRAPGGTAPEPGTLALLGVGVAALAAASGNRRRLTTAAPKMRGPLFARTAA